MALKDLLVPGLLVIALCIFISPSESQNAPPPDCSKCNKTWLGSLEKYNKNGMLSLKNYRQDSLETINRTMVQFQVVSVYLAGLVLCSAAQDPEVANSNNSHVSEEPTKMIIDKCNVYDILHSIFRSCGNLSVDYPLNTDVLLSTLQDMCSNEEPTRQCMRNELSGCENWNEINNMLETQYQVCANHNLPTVIMEALTGNETLSITCMRSILRELHCIPEDFPGFAQNSLKETVHAVEGFVEQHVNCFLKNKKIDEKAEECGDMTRRQVYRILVASLPVMWGLGNNYLPLMEKLVPAPEITMRDLEYMFFK